MKAIVSNPSGPVITAVDDPRPGSGEALVAIQAFSVNRGELDLLRTRTSGWRPGQDIAGVVAEQAADGSGPAAGTRIVALVEQAGWAELAAVPAARLAPLPAGIGTEQAAALPLAGLTALRTLRLAGDLLGRRVLVTGANGGVGRIQIQLAARRAPRSLPSPRPQHEKQLLALGASSVVADPAAAERPVRPRRRLGRRPVAGGRPRQGRAARNGHPRLQQHRENTGQHLRLLRPRGRAAGRLPVLRISRATRPGPHHAGRPGRRWAARPGCRPDSALDTAARRPDRPGRTAHLRQGRAHRRLTPSITNLRCTRSDAARHRPSRTESEFGIRVGPLPQHAA